MAIARGNNNGEAEKTTLLDTKFYVATFVSVLGTMFQSETLIFLSQKEIKMTNQSTTGDIRGLSRKVVTAVIVFVLAIVIFASTAFAQMASNYNVQIDVDNNTYSITTNETEPIEILSQANIALNDTDKLDISSFNAGKGGVIKIDRLNDVNVEFNGTINTYNVYGDTVKEALDEIGFNTNNVTLNCQLSDTVTSGMVIKYISSKTTTLKVDGETYKVPVVSGTVSDLLDAANVDLGSNDYTTPAENKQITKKTKVTVNRVTYKQVTKKEKIKYKTVEKENDDVYEGIETVVKKGKKGTANVTYKVKYVNGKKKTQKVVSKKVITKAKNKVVKVGTKETDGAKVKTNGVSKKRGYKVGQVITGRYTHYCACGTCGTGSGQTASGRHVSNGMKNPYYIACNWLPMGSIVNIDGTNYTVVDRGGSGLSQVGRVDIFTPEGHRACYRYGTGKCTLTIMRLGW
mgnify:FL=1|jgi:uncharacterized protein YabE (DUF348 family)